MFNIQDALKHVDMDQISGLASKVGLKGDQISKITDYAADAVKYRVNKESARGNDQKLESMFSENENTDDDNKLAGKMENDFVYNLTNKMGLPAGIADQLKGTVMKNILGGITKTLSEKGTNSAKGLLDNFGDSDMLNGFKKKLSNLF